MSLFERISTQCLCSFERASRRPVVYLVLLVALVLWAIAGRWLALPTLAAVLLWLALLFPLLALALKRLALSIPTIALLLLGLALYLGYFSYTTAFERNYDGIAHLSYITYVSEHGVWPDVSYCNICHHPPLFHLLGSAVQRFCIATKIVHPTIALQLLALVLFSLFVLFGVLFIKRHTNHRPSIHLATALLVFWPYSVINSTRVNNDVLLYALGAMVLYFLTRWVQDDDRRSLMLSCVFAALAVVTKVNGYLLVTVIVATLLIQLIGRRRRAPFVKRIMPALAMALLSCVLHAGFRMVRQNDWSVNAVVGSTLTMPPHAHRPQPRQYLTLDVRRFVLNPYVFSIKAADEPPPERQLYWQYFLKSSLFGHTTGEGQSQDFVADDRIPVVMNLLLLGMLAYCFPLVVFASRTAWRRHLVAVVTVGVLVAGSLAFWLVFPAKQHADFRFAFPILIPGALLYASAVRWYGKKHVAARFVGLLLGTLLAALSVAYFFPSWNALVGPEPVMPEKVSAPTFRPAQILQLLKDHKKRLGQD